MKQHETLLQNVLGEYSFDAATHQLFLDASGDANPIHADAHYAKQVMTGKIIAHGMHILLAATEAWSRQHTETPTRIRCKFLAPISIDETVTFTESYKSNDEWTVRVTIEDKTYATITVSIRPEQENSRSDLRIEDTDRPTQIITYAHEAPLPLDHTADHFIGVHFLLPLREDKTELLFPSLKNRIGTQVANAIMTCSYFVGMICPGLYSLCTMLDIHLNSTHNSPETLNFHVESFDERFNTFRIGIDGAIHGKLTAFRRQAENL